ncbi:GNAT family N-acetyltransferase [Balneatrix alpica]|uniref:GNAT family N-acetyltransferase n=1 Tax=Balneatrix alpica TaxID=75684 RepID=A0ABV5ZHB4_9GAMM|nr:GNAT family N-acetyltransferase [Balneatrix alpica]
MWTLRPATPTDRPFLLQLRLTVMVPHCEASGLYLSQEEQQRRVDYRYDCAQVIEYQGQPAGLLKLVQHPDHWELLQLQLAPLCQGQGIGRQILQQLQQQAQLAGLPIRLSVLKKNPARHLYERLGWQGYGEDEHEYWLNWSSPAAPDHARHQQD